MSETDKAIDVKPLTIWATMRHGIGHFSEHNRWNRLAINIEYATYAAHD